MLAALTRSFARRARPLPMLPPTRFEPPVAAPARRTPAEAPASPASFASLRGAQGKKVKADVQAWEGDRDADRARVHSQCHKLVERVKIDTSDSVTDTAKQIFLDEKLQVGDEFLKVANVLASKAAIATMNASPFKRGSIG